MSIDLPIAQIYPNSDQPRKNFDPEKLQELADSIKQNGLISPIAVRPNGDGYMIIAGERRWRAHQLAGLTTIRAEIQETDDKKAYVISIVENEQRQDLGPIETAKSLKKMMDSESLTQSQVARRIGKSRDWVAQKLRLLGLPEDVKNSMADGPITEAHGRQLLKLNGAGMGDKIANLAEQTTTKKWSVSRLESEVNLAINGHVSQDTKVIVTNCADGQQLTLTGDKARRVLDYATSLLSGVSQDTQDGAL